MGERVGLTVKMPEVNRNNSDSRMQRTNHSRSVNPSVDRILFLQRTVGNQAVQRLLRSGALQAKLRIGQPGDVYEQEADRVADAVMRMPEPGVQQQTEPEEVLQAKELTSQTSESTLNIESRINALQARGRHLPESTRSFFEPRFGHDFSQVRVHTNAQAAEMARAMNARAFTTGRDIVFGAGQYAPEATGGKKLLAHELTHVVQQNNFMDVSDKISTGNLRAHELIHTIKKSNISEQEADEVAKRVVNTINTSSLQIAPSTAQRQEEEMAIGRINNHQIGSEDGYSADSTVETIVQLEQSTPPPQAWTPSELRDYLRRLRSDGELLQGALEEQPDKPNIDLVRELVHLSVERYILNLDEYVRSGGDLLDILREIRRIPWPDDPPSREARDRLIRAIVEKLRGRPY